jgi:hypothetical protein
MADHPDFLANLWRRTRDRRTVQLSLAYLATGYAIIQFISAALRRSPRLDGVLDTAWVIYALGFLVVVFAVPLVLTGTHRFRSGFIIGIIATSLAAGMYLQTQLAGEQLAGDDAETDSEGDNSASRDPAANDDPGARQPPTDGSGREAQSQQREPPVVTNDETTRPAPDSVPAVRPSPLERLALLYGETDRVTLDTRAIGVTLLRDFASPIGIRFHAYSGNNRRLRITAEGQEVIILDLPQVSSKADARARVQTTCGMLIYRIDVVRLTDTAEVTATLDRAASLALVQRAEALGECRSP